jgi:hypothetical protein
MYNLVDFSVDKDYYGNAQSFVQGNFSEILRQHISSRIADFLN